MPSSRRLLRFHVGESPKSSPPSRQLINAFLNSSSPAIVISMVTAPPSTEICICRRLSLSGDRSNRNLDTLLRRSQGRKVIVRFAGGPVASIRRSPTTKDRMTWSLIWRHRWSDHLFQADRRTASTQFQDPEGMLSYRHPRLPPIPPPRRRRRLRHETTVHER